MSHTADPATVPPRPWPWGVLAACLAMAGLPIYIHAPKFLIDSYGIGLTALGSLLAALRLFDVVQDPALGWLATVTRPRRRLWAGGAMLALAAGMVGLFALAAPIARLIWSGLMLGVIFTCWSFLTICLYADGVAAAPRFGAKGHLRLAGWREGGALAGVCLAAVAPGALALITARPLAGFALGFAVLAALALWAMRREWVTTPAAGGSGLAMFRPVLVDPAARRLLLIALVNGAPVAVTSTLFLFFVESRLQAAGAEGGLLLLFFVAAALSTPGWTALALRLGAKRVLMGAMGLSILAFLGAARLGPGDVWPFALICIGSGAALGADNVLLPALFSRRLAALGQEAAAFGLWAFVSKLTLALAAALLLPLLDQAGFVPGAANDAAALWALSLAYAVLPLGLKALALLLLARTKIEEA